MLPSEAWTLTRGRKMYRRVHLCMCCLFICILIIGFVVTSAGKEQTSRKVSNKRKKMMTHQFGKEKLALSKKFDLSFRLEKGRRKEWMSCT